jgi:predicted esterase
MRQKIITSLIILIGFSGGSAWAAGIGGATTGTLPGAIGANGVTSNPGFGTTQGIGGYGTSPARF